MCSDCIEAEPGEIIERLRQDALRHIVVLKLLSSYPQHAKLQLREEGPAWALSAAFPVGVSDYDTRTYPSAKLMVVIDGNSVSMMQGLLADVPRAELVLKTRHDAVARAATQYGGALQRTFISFSGGPHAMPVPADVTDGTVLDADLADTFARFGNDVSFLDNALRHGARWFASRCGNDVRSACFVYQNFESIWEIAGVLTQPEWRRQGLARRVVSAGLQHLLRERQQARYQVDAENHGSVALARSLGLSEFLRIEHILIPARPTVASLDGRPQVD